LANKTRPTRSPQGRENREAGFALYLAMGFIVLMSILVAGVGDRLNIAMLNDARRTDTTALSRAAQSGVELGWAKLESLAPGAISLPADATDAAMSQDRANCLTGREDAPAVKFFVSALQRQIAPGARATGNDQQAKANTQRQPPFRDRSGR